MLASILALALVAQIAPDGLTISSNLPGDLATWRWVRHDGKAALAWGRIDDAGRFVAVNPAPEPPIYPGSKPKSADPCAENNQSAGEAYGGLPKYAISGVEVEKIDDKGLTLRASDRATADAAKDVLYEAEVGGPLDRIRIPKPSLKISPDLSQLASCVVVAGLFGAAGVIVVLRSLQSR